MSSATQEGQRKAYLTSVLFAFYQYRRRLQQSNTVKMLSSKTLVLAAVALAGLAGVHSHADDMAENCSLPLRVRALEEPASRTDHLVSRWSRIP